MLKITILGDSYVGKSSLINRFYDDSFSFSYNPTSSNLIPIIHALNSYKDMSFKSKVVEKDGRKLRVQIWDCTGKIEQNPLWKMNCSENIGVILMFSPQNLVSFQNLTNWMECLNTCSKKFSIALVSNSRSGEEQTVREKDIQEFATRYHLRHYQINVKDDFDVEEPFLDLVSQISAQNHEVVRDDYGNNTGTLTQITHHGGGCISVSSYDVKYQIASSPNIFGTVKRLESFPKRQQVTKATNQRNQVIEYESSEEIESIIRKAIKEVLSMTPVNEKTYESIKPINEVRLEYKQELLELQTSFVDFKSYITSEIERTNQRTKDSLEEVKCENIILSEKMALLGGHNKTLNMGTGTIGQNISVADNVYLLIQKVGGCEKKFSEGMCYMENKLKLLGSAMSKEITQKFDEMVQQTICRQHDLTHQTGPVYQDKTHKRRFSVFKAQRVRSEEPENFGEAVDRHNLSTNFVEKQMIPQVAFPKNFEREISKSFDTLDLSSGDIQQLDCSHDLSLNLNKEGDRTCKHELLSKKSFSLPCFDVDQQDADMITRGQTQDVEEEENYEQENDNKSEDEFYDDKAEGSEEKETTGALKEEINSIWNTINQFVNNTQDHLQDLKEQILDTSMNVESRLKVSICPIKEDQRVEKEPLEQKDNIQILIKDVKDDVHNQIVQVQKELEHEIISLRDNILCQQNGFSNKIRSDYYEIKTYIDEKIDNIKYETMKDYNENLQNFVVQSCLIPEARLVNSCVSEVEMVHSCEPSCIEFEEKKEDITSLQEQVKENQHKIQKDLGALQNKLNVLEQETMNSLWNTIGLVVCRLDNVEKVVKCSKK